MKPDVLLALAKKHQRPTTSNISIKKWTPVIVELRSKDFTWKEIWDFLNDHDETVHANWRSFAAGASRIHSNYLARLAKEAGK